MVFRIFILIFCLAPTVKKNIWMRTISITVMVSTSKVQFWKLLDTSKNISDISYVQNTFLHLRGTLTTAFQRYLQLRILWKWINITYVLILLWVNIMKRKWAKVPRKLSVVQKPDPALWRKFHLLYYSFSLKQT